MRLNKLFLSMAALVSMLFGPNLDAWGKSAPSGETPSCLVSSLPNKAVALKGAVAVEASNVNIDPANPQVADDFPADVDITIRLENKAGQLAWFRLHLFKIIGFLSSSDESTACLFLDPSASGNAILGASAANQAAASALVRNILTTFNLQSTYTRLVIVSSSISKNEVGGNQVIPNTGTLTPGGFLSDAHGSSLADITIYAIP